MREDIGVPGRSVPGRSWWRGGGSRVRTRLVPFASSRTAQVRGQFGKECGGGHDQSHLPVPAVPGSDLAVIEAEIALGPLETFLDGPAQAGGTGQFGECGAAGTEGKTAEALAKLCWIRSPIPGKARVLERLATISGWRGGLSRLPRNRIGELGSVSDLSLAYGHRPPVSPLWGAPAGGWGASPFELRSAGAAAG